MSYFYTPMDLLCVSHCQIYTPLIIIINGFINGRRIQLKLNVHIIKFNPEPSPFQMAKKEKNKPPNLKQIIDMLLLQTKISKNY